jgi:hypothetical protein
MQVLELAQAEELSQSAMMCLSNQPSDVFGSVMTSVRWRNLCLNIFEANLEGFTTVWEISEHVRQQETNLFLSTTMKERSNCEVVST